MKPVFHRAKQSARAGFTLVELLIVISIIGVLVALLMPAINSARESGRRAQCSNNLHQMASGCLQHEAKYQYLPTGGWAVLWGGEADRGFGISQPGGWQYSILPFIDQNDLHDLDKGLSSQAALQGTASPSTKDARFAAGTKIAQTTVPLFLCPSRSKVKPSVANYETFFNIDPYPNISRSDYAANAGSSFTRVGTGPKIQGAFPIKAIYPTPTAAAFDWSQTYGALTSTTEPSTGVIFRASQLSLASVKVGASFTYMIGERYLCPDAYNLGKYEENDQGWDEGYDYDTIRGTLFPPAQDHAGQCGAVTYSGQALNKYMITFGRPPSGRDFIWRFANGSVRGNER